MAPYPFSLRCSSLPVPHGLRCCFLFTSSTTSTHLPGPIQRLCVLRSSFYPIWSQVYKQPILLYQTFDRLCFSSYKPHIPLPYHPLTPALLPYQNSPTPTFCSHASDFPHFRFLLQYLPLSGLHLYITSLAHFLFPTPPDPTYISYLKVVVT
ncbi:hypothetical protein CROQUDRAFT_341771 [Cronartium quercuum f. sp. fusiforme G11]|uniref:Uncharacterized protein n=1 Tax=Cronartium quercuum f. sp. fusiforme G11 TaxID=708437 RepID=A0A9P6NS84_9BASI|nr:hypothetical protein CROQUDRAFT_341771 [Cronartium quercuum f. sp. fusiforme G11]